MVVIRDGEILQDDDPRAHAAPQQQRANSQQASPSTSSPQGKDLFCFARAFCNLDHTCAANKLPRHSFWKLQLVQSQMHLSSFRQRACCCDSPAGQGGSTFNFSAAPVRLHHEPPQQSLFGLPGIDIFGAHFQSRHLAALLGATLFLGIKGFLAGKRLLSRKYLEDA